MKPLANRVWLAIVAVAAVQTAVLLAMAWSRVQLLRTGQEITLETVPVDPRSLFRGDYVRLGYGISRIEVAHLADPLSATRSAMSAGTVVYVTAARGADGKWTPTGVGRSHPARPLNAGEIVLKGRTEHIWGSGVLGVRYGIEKFFVPEGTGLELETMARDRARPLTVVLAVDADGNAAIKRILFEGRLLKEETPL